MPGADKMLRVAIDAKSFGARAVLENIRFEGAPGEVLALLAPSGTGKTTILRILLGLDRAFSGTVERPGGRAGMVFQDPLLLPWLDVAGNLRVVEPGLTNAALHSLLEMIGLPGVASLRPRELSLGMARRVALARALAVRPALLLMDEPFASLDQRLGGQLGRDVSAHARSMGAIVVMATHDLDQAVAVADRVLVLGGNAPASLAADRRVAGVSVGDLRREFAFLGDAHSGG